MRTRVTLKYILQKNDTNLSSFLRKNGLKSYDDVLAYCDGRDMIPVSADEYNQSTRVVSEEKNEKKAPPKAASKGTASKAQKKPRSRSSSRKVKKS